MREGYSAAKIEEIYRSLEELRRRLSIEDKEGQIRQIEKLMQERDFWGQQEKSKDMLISLKRLKNLVEPYKSAYQRYKEIRELLDILTEEKDLLEIDKEIDSLKQDIRDMEFNLLFSDKQDINSAFLSINAGAGGTEACDWVSMLLRMYLRWAEKKRYNAQIIDFLPGEEAGIKNVTVLIKGDYAYGYLKMEKGVHRLVRISPFDANRRRHTSFASVDVIPEIEDDAEIEISQADLRIDVYRASGPGGQGVNTTDSAVRITHLPTGIVVQCQNERSQIKNRATALKVLKARLYAQRRQQEKEREKSEYAQKMDIAWGSQIRSYIMHPYRLVKDHRTRLESTDVDKIMDGEIDIFLTPHPLPAIH